MNISRLCLTLLTRRQTSNLLKCKRFSSTLNGQRRYIPRRTVMYIPGHEMNKLQKVPILNIDCAVLECEDGVALNKKAEARENIRVILDELDFGKTDPAVRVNSVSSGLFEEDLQVIFSAKKLPQTILLPKVDTVDELRHFTDTFKSVLLRRNVSNYQPYLIIYAESAQGLLNLRDVLNTASALSKDGIYKLDGVVFGSDDFCADIGATRTSQASEVMYARQKVVMTAKAYRLQAIDMVSIDLKDQESLRRQSLEGAKMGYTGKQVIHPSQVSIVNKAFTPSQETIEWATKLIAAFDEHQSSGKGAFSFRGNMIDMPLLLQAKNILQNINNQL